jgi:site-specific recombinase XerD
MKFSYTSVSQQNQIINSIKTMYLFILGVKLNIQGVERPRKEKRLPQPIDENTLINSINKICNLKHKAIIRLAYSSGMRRSEIINLKIENIDSKRMQIKVIQGKGKKDRIIPLTDGSLKILREYYIQYKPKEYLFNGQNSLKYSGTSLNNIVKKYIGDRYHFHQIRHSCFTHLTDKGIDIRVIQKLAGHSSSKTTEIYTKVSTKNLANLPLF